MSSSFQNETFPCCIKTSCAFAPTNVPKKDIIICRRTCLSIIVLKKFSFISPSIITVPSYIQTLFTKVPVL